MQGWRAGRDMQGVNETTCDSPIVSSFVGSLLWPQEHRVQLTGMQYGLVDSVMLENIAHDYIWFVTIVDDDDEAYAVWSAHASRDDHA